jgi:Domain of unknown function (DUF1906)
MVGLKGIDYAWGRPRTSVLKKGGYSFVMRYLSHDTGKNLRADEAQLLSDAGIWIGVVWETTATRAGSGKTAGIVDATNALMQAKECGMPDDRPIYFAVDWDAQPSDDHAIHAYLDGCAAILGRDRVGMYGGYGPIKRAFDAKKIVFGWQTYAWSNKKWDSRAQIQQYSNSHFVDSVDCDYNRVKSEQIDFGQWKVGDSFMALSNADKEWIVEAIRQVWREDNCEPPDGMATKDNPKWMYENVVRAAATYGKNANEKLDTILKAIDESPTETK